MWSDTVSSAEGRVRRRSSRTARAAGVLGCGVLALAGASNATGSGPAAATGAPLQPSTLTVQGSFPMGSLSAVDIDGATAWVTQGRWVLAVDTAIGAAPQVIGRVMAGVAGHVAVDVESGRALAVGPGGMYVLDVTAPAAPAVVGHLAGEATDVRQVGDIAVLAGATVRLVSLADPSTPVQVGSIDVGAGRLDVAGSVAFLAAGEGGLAIWDVSQPDAPVELAVLDTAGPVVDVALLGTLAVVADAAGHLSVVDVADPSNPAAVGSYDEPRAAECGRGASDCPVFAGVAAWGTRAYVTWTNCGGGFYCRARPMIRVIDLADAANPLEVAAIDLGADPVGVAVAEGRVVVAESPLWWYAGIAPCSLSSGGMGVFDNDLRMLGRFGVVVGAAAIDSTPDTVYLAEPARTVTVVDATDPTEPRVGGSVPVVSIGSSYGMGGPTDVAVHSGTAYVSRGSQSLYPPEYAGTNGCSPPPSDQWFRAVAMGGDHLYGLDNAGAVQTLSRRGLSIGRTRSSLGTVMDARLGLAVVSGPSGTSVIDGSDPSAPEVVGTADVVATSISQVHRLAFLAAGGRGLVTLDLADPARPVIVDETAVPGNAIGVDASGGLVFVANGESILVFDASEPTPFGLSVLEPGSPALRAGRARTTTTARLIAEAPLPGARMVAAEPPYVYAVAAGGLYVLALTSDLPAPLPQAFLPTLTAHRP